MIRTPNLNSAALLDHVRSYLVRVAPGRVSLPPRAYLADSHGQVTVVDLPALDGADDHAAAGAALGALMRAHSAAYAVLQLPHHTSDAGRGGEVVGLYAVAADGRELGRLLLALERRADGHIARVVRTSLSSGNASLSAAASVH
jgi:hypothetical protein